ncbi:MAG: MipA/OmpV family protein [Hyphomicrobiaceae bacterium]
MTTTITRLSRLALLATMAVATPAFAGGFGETSSLWPSAADIGGYAIIAPKYEGSNDYRVYGFPIAIPAGLGTGDGFIQFRGADDVRLRVIKANGFEAGPVLGWRFDRDENDGHLLRGLGDVDGGLVIGGYAGYRFGALMPYISYSQQVTGDDTGGLLRLGAEARFALAPGVSLLAVAGATHASKDYADTYFSVSAAQSAASVAGLPVYSAGAGFKDAFLGLSTDIPLSPLWTLKLSGKYSRLIGDAADSPIVESENQFAAGIGLTYRISLTR